MLLWADCLVRSPRLNAYKMNERRMAKFSETMDPFFIGKIAALLQFTQFAYLDVSTRERMSNAAIPKPGKFEKEWAELELAPAMIRRKADLQEAAIIGMNVRPELAVTGKLLTRTALAPFGCDEFVIRHRKGENRSAGELVVPKFPVETMSEEQGPPGSGRGKERDDEEQEGCQPEKLIEHDHDQAGKDDNKVSVGGCRDFNFLDEDETETVAGTTEPAKDETSTLEPPSAFMNAGEK